jgi:hypothetical protein
MLFRLRSLPIFLILPPDPESQILAAETCFLGFRGTVARGCGAENDEPPCGRVREAEEGAEKAKKAERQRKQDRGEDTDDDDEDDDDEDDEEEEEGIGGVTSADWDEMACDDKDEAAGDGPSSQLMEAGCSSDVPQGPSDVSHPVSFGPSEQLANQKPPVRTPSEATTPSMGGTVGGGHGGGILGHPRAVGHACASIHDGVDGGEVVDGRRCICDACSGLGTARCDLASVDEDRGTRGKAN